MWEAIARNRRRSTVLLAAMAALLVPASATLGAAIDPSAGGNPIPVDAPTLERIFRAAVKGDLSLEN